MTSKHWGKNLLFFLVSISMALVSCAKQDDIDNLQKQIDNLKSNEIATVQQQMSGIQLSLGNLQTVDTELRGYIRMLQDQESKLAQADEALEGSIASLKTELKGDISAAKSDALAQLETYKANVSSQLAALRASIDSLKSKDADLQTQITSLQSYIDGDLKSYIDNGDKSVKTWASASFATLTQYNATADLIADIQGEISSINDRLTVLEATPAGVTRKELDDVISALDADHQSKLSKAVSDCNEAIASAKEEITAAYTTAIANAIAASESSMRTWVNDQLSGYYTIAQADAKIAALKTNLESQLSTQKTQLQSLISNLESSLELKIKNNADDIEECRGLIADCNTLIGQNAQAISDNAAAIAQLRTNLGTTKTEITTAYQQAISTAIGTLDGQLRGEIATQVETVNSRIDDEVAAVNATIDALTARVTQCEEDIRNIKSDIQAMQQAIDDLSDKIATVQQQIESINGAITNLQNADAELLDFIDALQNTSEQTDTLLSRRISAAIDSLTAKDEDLKRQIDALQTYVDGGIQSTKDWASATFLTLAQYDATAVEIAGIQADITAINSWLGSLKDSYSSLSDALAASEQSMKGWVNEQLTGYYTIAQADANLLSLKTELEGRLNDQKNYLTGVLDSLNTVLNEKINTNASDIEECRGLIADCNTLIGQNSRAISDNVAAIAQLRTDLGTARDEITAAYQQAISTAINDLDGQLRGEIATQVNSINSRIDDEVAAINATIDALTARVTQCESDIQAMKSDIQALRDDVDELQEKVAAILSRIQSITYVPLYSDGKASVDYSYDGIIIPGEVVFDFEIRPASVAAELTQVWETALSMKAVYTITRSALDFVPLDIISATAQNGILTVTASGSQLKEDFFLRRCSASASLSISDGNNKIASDYIQMTPSTNSLIAFNDANLKQLLVASYDKDGDGEISHAEACLVSKVDCPNAAISEFRGIEHFRNLKYLDVSGNAGIDTLNLGYYTQLETLKAGNTGLIEIDLANNRDLKMLDLNGCIGIHRLDISVNTKLLNLNVSSTSIDTLDVSNNTALKDLDISNTPFKSIVPIGYNLSIGVVFYNSGNVVKIISKDESKQEWGYRDVKTNAVSITDGMSNTDIILSGSPAAQWCRSKGETWYLPAKNELEEIYNNQERLNTTLSIIGGIQFNYYTYWSSTEHSGWGAYGISFVEGREVPSGKQADYRVRAVRAL